MRIICPSRWPGSVITIATRMATWLMPISRTGLQTLWPHAEYSSVPAPAHGLSSPRAKAGEGRITLEVADVGTVPEVPLNWICKARSRYDDKVASASASTSVPLPMSSGEAYSSGRWLYPFRQGINNIAAGATREMNSES